MSSSQSAIHRPVKVLLVDDREADLLTLRTTLEPLGEDLEYTSSAQEAVARASSKEFAVILLDMQMPRMSGIEVARHLRQAGASRATPFIFVTANDSDRETTTAAYAAGAADVLFKPFDPDVVRAKVRVFAELFRGRQFVLLLDDLARQALQLERQADDARVLADSLEKANTQLQEMTRQEQQARRAAEAASEAATSANRAKSDFLATMSHEIRTPINAIIGYSQLLELGLFGPLTSEQRTHIARIDASTHHLLGLVNEILDLAKVESGTLVIERERAVAADTVDAALALIRPQAAAKGIALSEQCEGAGTSIYLGDEYRARQVLTNLLGNAVKFTEPGGRIVVTCAMSDAPPIHTELPFGAPAVAFRVQDTGIGIPSEQLARIFEPFTQAESGYTRQRTGTGLGLTISRRLARLMDGEITVESAPGTGSVFTLWLPAPERRRMPRASTGRDHEGGARSPGGITSHRVSASQLGGDDVQGEFLARAGQPKPEMVALGEHLVESVGDILARWRERVRHEDRVPHARRLPDVQLDDHAATFLTDLALALRTIGQAGGDAAELIRDGSEIMRLISERHGAQRRRLGFEESHLQAELYTLRDEAIAAIERAAMDNPGVREGVGQASELVANLFEQGLRISRRSFRVAADAM